MKSILLSIADLFRETDKVFLIICALCTGYGCVAVFSATAYTGSLRQPLTHLLCGVIGLFAALVISSFDFDNLIRYWYAFAFIGLVPVILTFFIGFAPGDTDDKAWLNLGFTTFQPAELLKICFIITFSAHLSSLKDKIKKLKYLIPALIHGMIPVILIHFQGDDGTALVFLIMVIFMLIMAGMSVKHIIPLAAIGVLSLPFIYLFVMNEDQKQRITYLFDINSNLQGIGYQQYRGRLALENGGLTGMGLFKGSLTQVNGVPEGQNDFIFVSIGEELGFIGCILVIVLLVLLLLRVIYIARNCNRGSGKLICVGFFAMVMAQAVINIGMCLSVLPVIGITLPFFSAGGTSLACLFLGVGLVLGVYSHRNKREIYLRNTGR